MYSKLESALPSTSDTTAVIVSSETASSTSVFIVNCAVLIEVCLLSKPTTTGFISPSLILQFSTLNSAVPEADDLTRIFAVITKPFVEQDEFNAKEK